ncbi:hypothetical protein F4821DRAFT_244210, partial [Hypoxylon rubiginosum]
MQLLTQLLTPRSMQALMYLLVPSCLPIHLLIYLTNHLLNHLLIHPSMHSSTNQLQILGELHLGSVFRFRYSDPWARRVKINHSEARQGGMYTRTTISRKWSRSRSRRHISPRY